MILYRPETATWLSVVLLFIAGCQTQTGTPYITEGTFAEICEGHPGEENAKLPLSDASDDWFQVYEAANGVYSIVEPYQFEETISHLIVGEDRALLFDTGLGLLPIRPVVERVTSLPVSVLNSHTHYDHVGGNAESGNQLVFVTDGVEFVTAQPVVDGRQADISKGGSGLDTWP